MSVPVGNRKVSKVEYDSRCLAIHKDCVELIDCNFGAKKEVVEARSWYISRVADEALRSVFALNKYIKVANSIYPISQGEYVSRRLNQGRAIGMCFDILSIYQCAITYLGVKNDKYVEPIKHIMYEIYSIKNWMKSDSKRFGYLLKNENTSTG